MRIARSASSPGHRFSALVLLALAASGSTSCGSVCSSSCGSGAHYQYVCAGWISPSCGTYCIRGNSSDFTIVSNCCCEGKSASPTAPLDPLSGDLTPGATLRSRGDGMIKARGITSRYD
jgi:hypothetical protein